MEDNDDEKYFETGVYSQSEANQYAEMQARLALCRIKCGHTKGKKYWYLPVQDNTKLEDGDANQLGHSIFVRQKQCLFTVARGAVLVVMLSYFLRV